MSKNIKPPKKINKLTQTNYLHLIEMLASNYCEKFGMDADKLKSEESKFASLMYRISHIGTKPTCLHSHDSWLEEARTLFNSLKSGGL